MAVAALTVGCSSGGGSQASAPPTSRLRQISPAAYLAEAIRAVRTTAYYADQVDWPTWEAEAKRVATSATSTEDTYPFVDRLVAALGDHRHSQFIPPSRTGGDPGAPGPMPTGSRRGSGVAMVALPGFSGTSGAGRYIDRGRALTAAGPCGWVLDLRQDVGGNATVMLSAIAPLLGPGPAVRFRDSDGAMYPLTISPRGAILEAGHLVVPARGHLTRVPSGTRIAVVQGVATNSAGEAVVLTFRGRATSRSFGFTTAGRPSSTTSVALADGSVLRLTNAIDVDHAGVAHEGPIEPDERILDPDAALAAARAWSAAGARCR
ncbi:MAG: Nisin-resistance protein [Acidimicrobiales bacterium]|nr:Nisin-resistance protein [Acidimicrobiales bacterium]